MLQHVTISSSYENWKTNVSGAPLSTVALLNNTTNPSPSLPAFGTAHGFEVWLRSSTSGRSTEHRDLAAALTSVQRAGPTSREATWFLERIREDQSAGRTVFCLLGKIPYDLAVPNQGGPAHASMSDWLNHSIRVINQSENSVLYIKPHPHETNDSIAARPMQGFLDMIAEPLSDRITTLPHRGVNVTDLVGEVDVFLVWNGSSIAELGALGATVVASDEWATRNYPIEVFAPSDRDHYERILMGVQPPAMHRDFQTLSEAYVVYLTEAPFALPYPMVDRSSTNVRFNSAMVQFERDTLDARSALDDRRAEIASHFGVV